MKLDPELVRARAGCPAADPARRVGAADVLVAVLYVAPLVACFVSWTATAILLWVALAWELAVVVARTRRLRSAYLRVGWVFNAFIAAAPALMLTGTRGGFVLAGLAAVVRVPAWFGPRNLPRWLPGSGASAARE